MTRGRTVTTREQRKTRREGNTIRTHSTDYYGKTPESRAMQLGNLKQYSGKCKPKDPNAPARPKIADLKKCDIIEFATEHLGLSFEDRPCQEVILRSQYGLDMDEAQLAIYAEITNGRDYEPGQELDEGVWCLGRRSGKSWLIAIMALYEAICRENVHRKGVHKGQILYAILVCTKHQQAIEVVQSFCTQILLNSRLEYLVKEDNADKLLLTNKMCIQSFPASRGAIRGYKTFFLAFDEIAYFWSEGPRADKLVYESARPGTKDCPNSKIVMSSSPAGKEGIFWNFFDEGFNVEGRLTVQAATRIVNPVSMTQEELDAEYEFDEDFARREYGAVFAESVSGWFASCMPQLLRCFSEPDESIPYQSGIDYYCAIDQSGLAGKDRFALAISHYDSRIDKTFLDVCEEWPLESLKYIITEIKSLCTTYHIGMLRADSYAEGYVRALLNEQGISMEKRARPEETYTNLKNLIRSDKIILPDRPSLKNGLIRAGRALSDRGTVSVLHKRDSTGHGDLADSAADAIMQASDKLTVFQLMKVYVPAGVADEDDGWDEWRD